MFSFQNSNAIDRKQTFSGAALRTKQIYGGFIVPVQSIKDLTGLRSDSSGGTFSQMFLPLNVVSP